MTAVNATPSFGAVVARARAAGRLIVQPRIGMGDPEQMRAGLLAVKNATPAAVGTITLDSYTRIGDHESAARALRSGAALNGYPLVAHSAATTREVLRGVTDSRFPVQVRHGSAAPQEIFRALLAAGLDATEGGPVSYCLPYSRKPLRESIQAWRQCCELLAAARELGREPHLETFGGCMLGQLCPPSLLVAISILEGLFFNRHGLRSVSLSYAQQTHSEQDAEAVTALGRLADEFLLDVDWHIVIYAYMGLYPRTAPGATRLLKEAARLAVRTGAARLIVKTTAEAHRIPTVQENVTALKVAAAATEREQLAGRMASVRDTGIHADARAIVTAVLGLHEDIGSALARAFERGYLDVPYCLHPDNAGRTRSFIDGDGWLRWSDLGRLPVSDRSEVVGRQRLSASGLLTSLSYVVQKFDRPAFAGRGEVPISFQADLAAPASVPASVSTSLE